MAACPACAHPAALSRFRRPATAIRATREPHPFDLDDERVVGVAVDDFVAGMERSGHGRSSRWLAAYRSLPRDVRFNLTPRSQD